MKLNVYSIFDSAAKAYTQPFFMHNDGLAIRAFQDNVNAEQENNISKHPDQFTLFKIAEFDDATGQIEAISPRSLGNGLEFKTETEISESISKLILEKLDSLMKEQK
jgi:hypothetical protein